MHPIKFKMCRHVNIFEEFSKHRIHQLIQCKMLRLLCLIIMIMISVVSCEKRVVARIIFIPHLIPITHHVPEKDEKKPVTDTNKEGVKTDPSTTTSTATVSTTPAPPVKEPDLHLRPDPLRKFDILLASIGVFISEPINIELS
uniref:Uncharacterized protein n=1 Tax=Trichobilharzia regenti TaxID=157069 RepID=A0AA85J3A0_TRIRE|nr:unnamed protein product [Trichobilharzia regenti]